MIIYYIAVGPFIIPPRIIVENLVKPIKIFLIIIALLSIIFQCERRLRFSAGKTVLVTLLSAYPLYFFVFQAFDPNMAGDAGPYYAWLRSFMLDGDLDLSNDLKMLFEGRTLYGILTPNGQMTVKYPIGVSLYEIPGFIAGFYTALITGHSLQGWSPLYFYSIGISNLIIFAVSIRLFYLTLAKQYNPAVSLFALALMVVATNAIHYLMRDVGYAHLPGLTVSCLLVWLANLPESGSRKKEYLRIFMAGLLFGLLLIIRNTNLLLAPFLSQSLF